MLNHQSYTDGETIALLKNKDKRALKEVYDRYWYILYRNAHNLLGDEDAAKDAVQEVFIALWEKIGETDISNLKNYLQQALKYRCFMHLRKQYTSQKHLAAIKALTNRSTNITEEAINLQDTEMLLAQSIADLPARCGEIFRLSRQEQLTHQEIATRLDISIKTVENQITKTLKILKGKMRR